MSEPKHTRTPWQLERIAFGGPETLISRCGASFVVKGASEEQDEIDAAFIVDAVNAHDELVEAHEALVEAVTEFCSAYEGNKAGWLGNGQARRSLDAFRAALMTRRDIQPCCGEPSSLCSCFGYTPGEDGL